MDITQELRYKTIYADPPWYETGGGKIKRGADRHYKLMKTRDICNLPIQDLISENAHLYLWVTNNFLKDGLKVMENWGFKYKTKITWVKGKWVNEKLFELDKIGLGQYFRGIDEICLFGVKGSLPYKIKNGKRQQGKTVIISPREIHSKKPEKMYEYIERVSYYPYLELFARNKRENWDSWGNEVDSLPIDILNGNKL